jgi:hypothetical protein
MSFTDKLKFASKRFSDLGIATSPQVNRLLFKNQEFREFASVNYLVEKRFIVPQEYYQFINKPICEEKPNTKTTEATTGGDAQTEEEDKPSIQEELQKLETPTQTNPELNDAIQDINDSIAQIQTDYNMDANDQKYIINKSFDYFKLNDKINMPLENPHFFNFLHLFKYTLSKGYSKFRMMRVYRILDGLMDALSNTYYFEGDFPYEEKPKYLDKSVQPVISTYNIKNNARSDKQYYPHTFLYAYRRNFVNRIKSFMGIGDQIGDDAFRVKNPCKEGSDTKNMYRQLKSFISWSTSSNNKTEELTNDLEKKIEEDPNKRIEENIDSSEDNKNDANTQPIRGGTRKYRKMQSKRRFKRNTKKIHGGFVLYTSRLYRALNMHISTTNLYNYSSGSNDPSVAKYGLSIFNKLTSVEKAEQIPAYVVKEQIRCLILADIYLTSVDPNNKINNYYRLIKRENTYDKLTKLIQTHVDTHPEFKEYIDIINKIDLLDTTVVDPKYNTFMIYNPDPQKNIHRIVKKLLEKVHNKVRYFSLDMTYIKKTFRHSTNMSFLYYTQNLFNDPRLLQTDQNPNINLRTRLDKYYEIKGLTKEIPAKTYPNEVINAYYERKRQTDNEFKKANPFKKDVIDFLYNFTFCVLMTPHFACSQVSGILVGSALNSYASLAEFSSSIVTSVVGDSGTLSKMVSATFMGTSIAASALSSIANTPNCYYSLGLMMYTLLFSLKPFMPQEGFAWRNPYMPRSNRLNSLFYRPPQSGLKRSLRDITNKSAIGLGNRFFTRKQPPVIAETQEQGTQTVGTQTEPIVEDETGVATQTEPNVGTQTEEQPQTQTQSVVSESTKEGGKRRTRRKRKTL